MGSSFATVTEEDGVVARSACVNGFVFTELRFPPGYVQDEFDPDVPYLALVLDGRLEKSFRLRTIHLGRCVRGDHARRGDHGARFGSTGARILIVKPSNGAAGCLDRLASSRAAPELACLAPCRRAPRIRRGCAARRRGARPRAARRGEPRGSAERRPGRPPSWLRDAEELLRARAEDHMGLLELAETVGVHPTHLARVFRAHFGVSVGEYGRRLEGRAGRRPRSHGATRRST